MRKEQIASLPPSRLNVKTKTIPISKYKKILRSESPIDFQKAIFSKFMITKVSRKDEKAFGMGFAISCVRDEEISKLDKETSKARRSYLRKRIHRLETQITPAKKQRAIDGRRPINAACLRYFRQYGAPKNIRHFIKWLSREGVLTRANKWGRPFKLSETTVRDILHNTFGIKGKPGRKSS